jgi:hypothetical protein
MDGGGPVLENPLQSIVLEANYCIQKLGRLAMEVFPVLIVQLAYQYQKSEKKFSLC